MTKSIIVLIGLLVILLPLGNSLNISNANAIADIDKEERKQVSVSSLKCNNINVNVNGLELSVLPPFLANSGFAAEAVEGSSDPNSIAGNNGDGSEINDFRFICINNNNNTVIEEVEEPIPPTPPPTASLTVKKQVFGCATIPEPTVMDCTGLDINSTDWLDCNNSSISDTVQCQSLPPSFFDIEVLDDQDNQIQEFKGSTDGTNQNLEPGTYTVNEIIHPQPPDDRLSVNAGIAQDCIQNVGFDNGGEAFNSTSNTVYIICLEYEDDCSTITLATGESRTCTVKNYIRVGNDFPPNSP